MGIYGAPCQSHKLRTFFVSVITDPLAHGPYLGQKLVSGNICKVLEHGCLRFVHWAPPLYVFRWFHVNKYFYQSYTQLDSLLGI